MVSVNNANSFLPCTITPSSQGRLRTPQGQLGRAKQIVAGGLTSATLIHLSTVKNTHTGDILYKAQPPFTISPSHFLTQTATLDSHTNKQTYTDLRTLARTPTPPGQGPMGVCTEIGHLSHMMSRGRGCIIDEPKQHVSVSTHHTARDTGGSSRRWAERG